MSEYKQGQMGFISLDPTQGHEQSGRRPVIIVSNDFFNSRSTVIWVCPITTKVNGYPLHVPLDSNTKIKGEIKCEQIRALDLKAREFEFIEYAPKAILNKVLSILMGTIKP